MEVTIDINENLAHLCSVITHKVAGECTWRKECFKINEVFNRMLLTLRMLVSVNFGCFTLSRFSHFH